MIVNWIIKLIKGQYKCDLCEKRYHRLSNLDWVGNLINVCKNNQEECKKKTQRFIEIKKKERLRETFE